MQETLSNAILTPVPMRESVIGPTGRGDFTFAASPSAPTPSFREFHKRALNGARLSVVFLGSSLTWGARASDPLTTSYRALIGLQLQARYPKAHFTFWDAAIGGTTSQLGLFRLERDVLSRNPDLVFIDFSVNDGLTGSDRAHLVSYEAIVRRLVLERCCVVQAILAIQDSVLVDDIACLSRRTAHYQIARAYSTAVGDAGPLMRERLTNGTHHLDEIWPDEDKVHPSDIGYQLYAEAVWEAFVHAVANDTVCTPPEAPIHSDAEIRAVRAPFSSLKKMPRGWTAGRPNTVAAFHDMLMSRWLDDEIVASNRDPIRRSRSVNSPEPLRARFTGSRALIFGESTFSSCSFSVSVDGDSPRIIDAGSLARIIKGNTHLAAVIATDLDPHAEHSLELVPIFHGSRRQELRLESLCVAGCAASVTLQSS